jgi:pimeloyl-ACP methyl ester carboxylesterase
MRVLRAAAKVLLLTLVVTGGCTPDTTSQIGGATVWLDVAQGRVKAQVFARETVSERPILVLILHGDIPDPRPDYQYLFAKAITVDWPDAPAILPALRTALGDDWRDDDIVAAGILRPGYEDPAGDRSSGDMGRAIGDNYTPEVVDAVASAAQQLEALYNARAVVLVGHSGGGAIVANILGRHPERADGALLVACGCDPEAWRSRMRTQNPAPMWAEPNPSLLPLALAGEVNADVTVRLIVGDQDEVTLPDEIRRYAEALQQRGVDAQLTIEPGLGHNMLITPAATRELGLLVRQVAAEHER